MHPLLQSAPSNTEAARADACRYLLERYGRARLGTWMLGREEREPLMMILAWHALLQENTDAGRLPRQLSTWQMVLSEAFAANPSLALARALRPVIRDLSLEPEPFREVLEAHAQRLHVGSFETRKDLLRQAQRSTHGSMLLLLRVLGLRGERCEILGDALACALQLIRWLENFPACLRQGFLPLCVDDLNQHGVHILSLRSELDGPETRALVAQQISWIRDLLHKGWPLCRELGGYRGRLLAFVLRQEAARLGATESSGCNLFRAPKRAGWLRVLACFGASLATRSAPSFAPPKAR